VAYLKSQLSMRREPLWRWNREEQVRRWLNGIPSREADIYERRYQRHDSCYDIACRVYGNSAWLPFWSALVYTLWVWFSAWFTKRRMDSYLRFLEKPVF
jgi:hypothetical protein